MKKYIFTIAAALLGLAMVSCSDKETYEPGPQADGIQYYFSTDEATAVTITPTTSSVDLVVYRYETTGATTLNVGISDPSGLISAESSTAVSFAAGSNKASLSIPFDNTKLSYGVGYPVEYTISDNTTPYGLQKITVTYTYPIPLTSLGKGTLIEDYYWGGTSNPEILQSDIDPNVFHVKAALKGISGNSEDLILTICQPGNTYNGVEVTMSDLVYYPDFNSGYHHPSYDADIYILHPSRFNAGKVESYWSFNRVLSYQENGLPAVVQLAPYYYMFNVGGWNGSQEDGAITIIFPGVVVKDFSVEAAYAGIFTDPDDKVFGEATVVLGEDVESGVAILVSGDSDEAIEAGIEALKAGDESVVSFTGSSVRLPLPENAATGKYTIIVGSYAEGEVQETATATFFYQAGSIAIDWNWLVGTWDAQDSEGDPYQMTVTKIDDNTASFYNIWGMESEMIGTVDFEAKTVAFKGPINLGAMYGGSLMVAHYNAEEEGYDDGIFYATLSTSGITISGMGYYLVGGSYDGHDFGTDVTKMTKAE